MSTKVNDESQYISSLEQRLFNIKAWMDSNRLKMNYGKIEFILRTLDFSLSETIIVVIDKLSCSTDTSSGLRIAKQTALNICC